MLYAFVLASCLFSATTGPVSKVVY
ncbi:hypothetical protein CCR75_002768 [Bremia lactucae]|uniref:Uncharacterized protein n=1 Tax=Bremia lactucae TaxID=4779 RepID=A0A976NY84_BRELC|nr:hypothetical protein CCR75_002768 [Bremia lactucae]